MLRFGSVGKSGSPKTSPNPFSVLKHHGWPLTTTSTSYTPWPQQTPNLPLPTPCPLTTALLHRKDCTKKLHQSAPPPSTVHDSLGGLASRCWGWTHGVGVQIILSFGSPDSLHLDTVLKSYWPLGVISDWAYLCFPLLHVGPICLLHHILEMVVASNHNCVYAGNAGRNNSFCAILWKTCTFTQLMYAG